MIPFLNLPQQYQNIKKEIDQVVLAILASGHYTSDSAVVDFENDFAAYCKVPHVVALNSGTSALHLGLLAAGIGPGDEVITVAMTFVATTAAILYTGAKPVFVDIDPVSWTLNPSKISAAITSKTRAIVVVHLHGLMADMDPIMKIAKQHGLIVIEDAAQAHGATYKGQIAGSIGDMGAFSFYPGKNLGACGEGGALVTHNSHYAEQVSLLRNWGQTKKYQHTLHGFNYRMDNIQGAILSVKLKYLDQWLIARRSRAHLYNQYLDERIPRPATLLEYRHTYHVYAICLQQRDTIQSQMTAKGIATGIHYPIPVHLQPAYAHLGYKVGDLPISEQIAKEMLSLPIYPELTDNQVVEICSQLHEILMPQNTDLHLTQFHHHSPYISEPIL